MTGAASDDRASPPRGYDYDTFADDLAQLVNTLNLSDVTFVGHSMGGGEVARYIGRHGQESAQPRLPSFLR